jgi:tight adherence protein C
VNRLLVLAGLVGWAGATLVLAELRWFRRPGLPARVGPHLPGGASPRSGGDGARPWRAVVEPLAGALGARLSRVFGVSEDLGARLERAHSPMTVTAFRMRQLGWSIAAFGAAAVAGLGLGLPGPIAVAVMLGGPLLAFLVIERQAVEASASWQRRVRLELPVVSEQLGMLLSAGYSVGGALQRLAERGHGACARDLRRVCGRLRQGLTEVEALQEWVAAADVDALTRLVGVLGLNREAGDLGRLVAEESRALRRDVQRDLIETVERHGQQVWVPVTVATLVPGVLFIAVPFVEALRLFTAT